MINKVVGDVAQAMAGVASGASIMISGFGNAGIPAALIRVLSDNDLDNLTLIINAFAGWMNAARRCLAKDGSRA